MAVNLSPIWGAGAQLLDNSGNVLSGGKIYTYAAGTTTQVATYTSNTGVTANSNPIVLNSAGRVPYEIWLTDGQNYKFVLKDSNDVLIGTWDNLSGINSNFIAYTNQQEIQTATAGQTVFNLTTMQYLTGTNSLSVFVDGVNQYGPGAQYAYTETDSTTVTFASGLHVGAEVKFTSSQIQNAGVADASQISYTAPYTDAVATNVEAKLAQYVSVKDFGAVGDGVVDDTDAIQNALDSGNNIYFPAGTYMHTGGLTQTSHGQHVYGESSYQVGYPGVVGNSVILKKISGTSDGWLLGTSGGGLHNISFDSNGLAGAGLKMTAHYAEVDNITIGNVGGTSYALELETVNTCNFNFINFFGTNYGGIKASGSYGVLYSAFNNVFVPDVTDYCIKFNDVANSTFNQIYTEGPMIIDTGCATLEFTGIMSEFARTTEPWIEFTDPIGITLTNIKFNQQGSVGDMTAPIFQLGASRNVAFYNAGLLHDTLTTAPVLWSLDGAISTTIENVWYYGYVNSTFVDSPNAYNIDTSVKEIRQFGTGSATCNWNIAYSLNCENTRNVFHTFIGAWTGTTTLVNMFNVTGGIDTTNLTSTVLMHCDTCDTVDDVANVAILTNCKTPFTYRVESGRYKETLLSVGTGATATWSGAIPKNALVKSVVFKNNGTVTGAAGFTGYTAGYTGATTAFGSTTGATNAEIIPKDYSIFGPFYNKQNGTSDIILTAVGGNFATGAVNIYLVYELIGSPI